MLGDYLEILGGGTPSRDVDAYWNGDLPWATVKDLTTKRISETYESITKRGAAECATNIVPANTLLISTRMALGRISITDVPMAFNQDLKALKITGPIDQDYLFHFLSGKEAYFISRGNGATVKGFKVDDIRTIPFDPPPLPTQRRIAAVLDKTQALVANDRRTLAVYDQLAKSLFLEMFGDPVRNERGWEIVTVSDVGTARLGKMLDAKKRTGLNPRPYLRNTNVQWRRIELHDLHEMDFDEKDRNEFALKKGDILMCEGGEVGRCGIWKGELEECYFQKAIHRIRLDPKMITAEFFVRLFMELVERNGLKDYVTTSTISHLTGEKLATVRIPLPPLKDQLRFERTIEVIEAQRILAETSLRRSEGLFGSLLQQAFAGGLG